MSQRLDKAWVVFSSLENQQHDHCVDLFRRPDGTYGFEEFRRDPEDIGAWTAMRYFSTRAYASADAALAAAEQVVPWLGERFSEEPSLRSKALRHKG